LPGPPQTPAPAPEGAPVLESVNRLVFDGRKLRYEDNHPAWDPRTRKVTNRSCRSWFDGSTARMFFATGIGGQEFPQGIIAKGAELPFVSWGGEIMPLTFAFRAPNTDVSPWALDKMEPAGSTLVIDGVPCPEYVITYSAPFDARIWLVPGQEYV